MPTLLTSEDIYAQLEALVLPTIEAYQTDLTVHDRNSLAGSTAPFLISYRPTGTFLIVLQDYEHKHYHDTTGEHTPAQMVEQFIARKRAQFNYDFSSTEKSKFLFFTGSDFESVTKERAVELVTEYGEKMMAEATRKPCKQQ